MLPSKTFFWLPSIAKIQQKLSFEKKPFYPRNKTLEVERWPFASIWIFILFLASKCGIKNNHGGHNLRTPIAVASQSFRGGLVSIWDSYQKDVILPHLFIDDDDNPTRLLLLQSFPARPTTQFPRDVCVSVVPGLMKPLSCVGRRWSGGNPSTKTATSDGLSDLHSQHRMWII